MIVPNWKEFQRDLIAIKENLEVHFKQYPGESGCKEYVFFLLDNMIREEEC